MSFPCNVKCNSVSMKKENDNRDKIFLDWFSLTGKIYHLKWHAYLIARQLQTLREQLSQIFFPIQQNAQCSMPSRWAQESCRCKEILIKMKLKKNNKKMPFGSDPCIEGHMIKPQNWSHCNIENWWSSYFPNPNASCYCLL